MYAPDMSKGPPRKLVTLDEELVRRIEDFRFAGRFKSESDAMRALIEQGLTTLAPSSSPPHVLAPSEPRTVLRRLKTQRG